jgi:hypothetical protein
MTRIQTIIAGFSLMFFFVAISSVAAQAPELITYQGCLEDNSGKPIDGVVAILFTIYNDSTAGDILWTESHPAVTVTEGLFSINMSFTGQQVAFNQTPNLFLGIKVGNDPEITPRTRIAASPLSLQVVTVDGAAGGTVAGDLIITGQVTVGPNQTNTGKNAFVAGSDNSVTQDNSVISGGKQNLASGQYAVVSGGFFNNAEGHYSTIGGGKDNVASGQFSTIPGGDKCVAAGDYSIAMGDRAKAWHDGSVVIVANLCPL